MLSTEDELSERHFIKDSSNHRHHAAGAAIKTPSSVRSFSKEMEYFQSVRVNISTIATYLVEGMCATIRHFVLLLFSRMCY